ncbi:MAG TPA: Rv3235 family protein [Nitriliruptorales bacterium]
MTAPGTRPTNAAQLRALTRHPSGHADPERLAVAVVRTYLEIEAGRRPLDQLADALSPTVYDRLSATLARRRREALSAGRSAVASVPGIRSVRALQVTRATDDTLEAAVAVHIGERTTAVCVRLEAWRGAWRVTELARPEDGLVPIPSRPAYPRPRIRLRDTS